MSDSIDNIYHDVLTKSFEEFGLFKKDSTVEYKEVLIQYIIEGGKSDPQNARYFTFALPIVYFIIKLFTHNRKVFDKVITWVKKKGMLNFLPRLEKEKIHTILESLDVNISISILAKLECDEDTYHGLCESLHDKVNFMALIGQCNTSVISQYLWTAYFPLVAKCIISSCLNGDDEKNEAKEMFSVFDSELKSMDDEPEIVEGYVIGNSLDITDNAAFDLFFAGCCMGYCWLEKNKYIDESMLLELKSVFCQLEFNKRFENLCQLYKDDKLTQHLQQLAVFIPELKNKVGKENECQDKPTDEILIRPVANDSAIQDFKDSTPKEKAKVLIPIIEELLDRLDGKEDAFLVDCDLADLKGIFEGILTGDAKEHRGVQQEIVDELSGTEHKDITSPYYYKDRLWLQPFFIIIGRLFNKGMLKGGQTTFVRALFPEKRGKDPVNGVVYKEEADFINTCRAKVSKGNNAEKNEDEKWIKYFTWIDECAR